MNLVNAAIISNAEEEEVVLKDVYINNTETCMSLIHKDVYIGDSQRWVCWRYTKMCKSMIHRAMCLSMMHRHLCQ